MYSVEDLEKTYAIEIDEKKRAEIVKKVKQEEITKFFLTDITQDIIDKKLKEKLTKELESIVNTKNGYDCGAMTSNAANSMGTNGASMMNSA
jgi:hypothetical protein